MKTQRARYKVVNGKKVYDIGGGMTLTETNVAGKFMGNDGIIYDVEIDNGGEDLSVYTDMYDEVEEEVGKDVEDICNRLVDSSEVRDKIDKEVKDGEESLEKWIRSVNYHVWRSRRMVNVGFEGRIYCDICLRSHVFDDINKVQADNNNLINNAKIINNALGLSPDWGKIEPLSEQARKEYAAGNVEKFKVLEREIKSLKANYFRYAFICGDCAEDLMLSFREAHNKFKISLSNKIARGDVGLSLDEKTALTTEIFKK